jgi:para-aminobenzoate synthetase component I
MKSKSPVTIFQELPDIARNVCFLHSANKSILAWDPIAVFSSQDDIDGFKRFAEVHKDKKLIGFLSYDLAYKLYSLTETAENDLALPNIYFLAFDRWMKFDKPQMQFNVPKEIYESVNFRPTMSREYYADAYRRTKEHIRAGNVYQINLTHRLEAYTEMPARILFTKIIAANPVEYLAYIEGDGFEVLSASPERFICIKNEVIETCPVKGTRPRGKTKEEDDALRRELLESEKEAAELNMITDLLRNDIGKVSQIGTVEVKGHRLINECPTVWHTYSSVVGKIATTPLEALISMLPGGSITGCPKKRAIEIIDELEPVTRGIYTGVIGHIDPYSHNLDFNIAIRTIIKKRKHLYLQVGGGIVYDSTEESEFEETLHKAASFMEVLC